MATIQNQAKQTVPNTSTLKTNNKQNSAGTLFTKENNKWMAIGGVIMVLGFILMSGGKSSDANAFNESEVYSFIRITLSPILVLAGLGTLVYAIMKKG